MKRKLPFPFFFCLLIFYLATAALLLAGYQSADGHLGYPQDDVYIHMAIAKNFAVHGVWGITPYGFSSTTSSPLWTLLIFVMYKIFGVNQWAPLVLGVLAGSGVVVLCYQILKKKFNSLRLTLLLLLFVIFTGLPFWAAMGMEHLLHGILTISLLYYAVGILGTDRSKPIQCAVLFILSALLTITRYEGLFLVGFLFLLFLIKKRTGTAFVVLCGGLFLISIYGLISVRNGWFFFPNTILLKGNLPEFNVEGINNFLTKSIFNLLGTPQLFMLILVMLMIFVWITRKNVIHTNDRYLFGIFMAITLIHLQCCAIGTFSRYETYLILTGCLMAIDKAASLIPDLSLNTKMKLKFNDVQAAAILLFALPVLQIAFSSGLLFRDYPIAVQNIHDQQYQMGRFLQKYYSGKTVAVNDIGLVSFMSGSQVLDLWGLGSIEVAREILGGTYYPFTLAQLTKDHETQVVIIFENWFRGVIPPEWVKVGEWALGYNVVCGDDYVSFYVITADAQEELAANLRDFSPLLPDRVIQSGLYVE